VINKRKKEEDKREKNSRKVGIKIVVTNFIAN
jgi:hypothetical protein